MEDNQQQKPVNQEALYIQVTQDLTQVQHAMRLMQMELNELKAADNADDITGETVIENGKDKPKPN